MPAAAGALPGRSVSASPSRMVKRVAYSKVQHLHFEYGPIQILPGQNNIDAHVDQLKPKVPGFITRFKPNLVYSGTHKVPRVDVIHLHHGVWLMKGYPTFAAGEEKTTFQAPRGYGYHYDPSDTWILNYMIHNLWPNRTKVSITYDIDFVPDSAPAAKSMMEAHPLWLDVSGLRAYPVFDAFKGEGTHGRFTFPDQARPSQQKDIGFAHEFTAPQDMTLLGTAGHLHPGGLHTDLKLTRGSRTKELFRSEAKYFEPAGAVSWDVSMTATKPSWKVAVKKGDRLNVSATYDTRRASWYEVMGIMVVFWADGIQARRGGPVPVEHRLARPADARSPARERQPRREAELRPPGRRPAAERAPDRQHPHQGLPLRPRRPQPHRPEGAGHPWSRPDGRSRSPTSTPRRRSVRSSRPTTPSPRAKPPAQARPASRIPWPTAACSSTPASSATGPPASHPPPTGTPGARPRT